MQRWAGRAIWLRSAEASVERWTPPFCGIRTSVVCWLGNQSVGSPVPRQKKRAGDGVLGCSLLQPLWDRHWGGPGRWCFRPPALGGWRGDRLVWGPQQTWWMPCRPLQAWFCVCVCVWVVVSFIFYQVSRLSLFGHIGVLGSGRSPLVQAFGTGQGCVPVLPLDRCDMHSRTWLAAPGPPWKWGGGSVCVGGCVRNQSKADRCDIACPQRGAGPWAE